MDYQPSLALFAPLVGEVFVAPFDNGVTVALQLIEALPGAGAGGPDFQLRFRGEGPLAMTQSTYTLIAPGLGPLAIFLTPVPAGVPGTHEYLAVFA